MTQKFIAFDSETTGLEPGSRAVELAAILFDKSGILDTFETLINPGMPIPADVRAIHGIDENVLIDAPATKDALDAFFEWLPDDAILIAQLAQYDTGILTWECQRVGLPVPNHRIVLDTVDIAKAIKATKNNKLQTLLDHYGIERHGDAHRAYSDARGCMDYFTKVNGADYVAQLVTWKDRGHDYSYFDPSDIETVCDLASLVKQGARFSFVYEDDKGERTERDLTPYGWAKRKDEFYLHGWCHTRAARRTFRADRIQAVAAAA